MSEIEHLISICGKKVSNLFEVRLITVYMSSLKRIRSFGSLYMSTIC